MHSFKSIALLALVPACLTAQVGNPPDDSPFGEIRTSTTVEALAGTVMGSGGPIPVGPRDGPIAGARVLLRAKNTISIGFMVWGALTERTPIDPTATLARRFGDPVDQTLYGGEMTIQFNLTGGKTWRGIAPFFGVGVGLVKSEGIEDPAGYEFGSKFYFAPMLGTRFFINDRSYLRLEARGFSWKLRYPASYSLEPEDEPGTQENPNAVNPIGRPGQYVMSPTLMVGLGIDF